MDKLLDKYYMDLATKKIMDAEADLLVAQQYLIDSGVPEYQIKSFVSAIKRLANFRNKMNEFLLNQRDLGME